MCLTVVLVFISAIRLQHSEHVCTIHVLSNPSKKGLLTGNIAVDLQPASIYIPFLIVEGKAEISSANHVVHLATARWPAPLLNT